MRHACRSAKSCPLSEGYGHKNACAWIGLVVSDPLQTFASEICRLRTMGAERHSHRTATLLYAFAAPIGIVSSLG